MKTLLTTLAYVLTAGLLTAAEDDRPVVDAAKVPVETRADRALPTLHIVGDSTVRSGGKGGMWGWGERIAPLFDSGKINVVNHAIGGRSARTYFTEGRWQAVLDATRPGDFVIIQFGHNDLGRIGDPANKGRADGSGVGDETVEDTKPDGSKELVHTFGWYMAKFVTDAQAKKATVILCSPVPHKQRWETGRDFAAVAQWDAAVAAAHHALYFDLTLLVTAAYKKAGKDQVETFFADKGTHTSDLGAQINASCVIAGLQGLPGRPLERFLSNKTDAGSNTPAVLPGKTGAPAMKFSFGQGRAEPGWTQVAAGGVYSPATGYGFEPGAQGGGADCFTSDPPFLFSVKLPEGNYAVKVWLNDPAGLSVTTVKSEQRRLMLEKIQIPPGSPAPRTFVVNVRTPRISATADVKLKARELETETTDWDEKLTLEFTGRRPALRALEIAPVAVPTVFIAGDSTVCDQPAEPWNSWGQMLPRFFAPKVAVANYAQSGESIRSSLGARRFDKIFSLLKPGDYLFMQFGHNDQKDKDPAALASYRNNLLQLVARTRALGGIPLLVTSMERKSGVTHDTLAGYPDAVRSVAAESHCALIDLHAMSRRFYQALGADLDKAFQDGTHHNNYGSYELAKCVITGIQQAKLPLALAIAADFGKFDPAKPDPVATFELPASPVVSAAKPLGN